MGQKTDNFFGFTDTGRMRDNNEDTFIAETIRNGEFILACVIDGVGGYEGGEVAAAIAKDTLLQHLNASNNDPVEAMMQALSQANEKIYKERTTNEKRHSMSCVLTMALVDMKNNQFSYAHIGDTRLYLLRDRSLVKVTKDHSFVGFLEDSKRLSEEEAMRHPKRNEINKALGFDPGMDTKNDYVETGVSPFLPGDMLLLCSDGLTDLVPAKEITSSLLADTTLEQKCKTLIDAANNAGGKDNITVVLVNNSNKPVAMQALKPATGKKNDRPEQEDQQVKKETEKEREIVKKSKGGIGFLTPLLLLLLLGLAASTYWFWKKSQPEEVQPQVIIEHQRNSGEQQLFDSLTHSSGSSVLIDSSFAGPIIISDTISITKDTLRFNGNGQVWKADSAFRGPALFVSSSTKYLLLENLVLQDFDLGILAWTDAIHFNNVVFDNCKLPLLVPHVPPGGFIKGAVADTLNKKDSLHRN